jgi:ArsR family transcriptional regulator, arsenate/arsenite/antimonite-responsive transcriptional repressor
MAKLDGVQVQAIARVLADPRRFDILQQIARKEHLACSALREAQPISPATLSHHLKELADVGLVEVLREGRCADITFRRDVWQAYLAQLAEL